MKYFPGRSSAGALLMAAAMMRMFWGLSVDYPVALNATWICPLLGFVISLPLILSISVTSKMAAHGSWQNLTNQLPVSMRMLPGVLFALILLYDAAVTARLTASSSNIIALGDVTVHYLILPLAFVICALVLMGPDAAGHSARIALRILPLFGLILLAVQLKHYRFAWLTPVLGNGVKSILAGAVYCAGSLALVSLIWLCALPDRNSHSICRDLFAACLTVSFAFVCLHMSYPVMPDSDSTRAARIELILSNGRMSLSPHLLLNILWYGGLLYLLAADVLGAASYLHDLLPHLPLWVLAAVITLILSVTAVFNPLWLQNSQKFTQLYFPIIGTIVAICMLAQFIRKRGRISCENSASH